MLLKNLMEDKKLNFNQPLLSVRRYAPALTSQKSDQRKAESSRPVIPRFPAYRSELKSGPIRNPGAVPFVWEQTPGQPKEEIKSQTQNCDRPLIAPKLPPGRYPEANQQDCRKVPPSISRSKNQAVNVPCASDNKKQAVNVPRESHSNPSHDENDKIFESSKETVEEKDSSDSGDSDGAYVDALDTLSRTESFFLNCSTSGLSGLDDLDAKPTGSFSMDLQTRDFMMNRFLPAAKAMASETPQYAPKRQHVVQEQPQKVKNIGTQFKPSLRYGPSFAKRYSHYHDDGEEEEESDDEYDQQESLPAVCGLLPRFCLKSSLCLLNPVPAMSVRTRVPTSSANKVQPRSSSAGSYSETENECRSGRTEPKSIDKIHKVKLDDEKTELTNESCRLESDSTSTYRDSPLSFLEDKEVHCIPEEKIHVGLNGFELQEGIRTFKEILADQGSPKESDGGALIIEKTLYVDTIGRVESPSLRSFSPDTQDTLGFPTSREEYHEIINNSMDQIPQ
ncbi:UNVERIFIED_CONTAM: hypothetical protein Sangu_2645600 [Sesamum angustifolium]|uniref:Uncharacterized protein n=1 Tax=Sesamum angustifolium TaxID=2727405 RepID=A0AAW2J3D9_9LAMI